MVRQGLGIAILALMPTFCHAQKSAEDLLPASTQVYFRWDGQKAHQAAFAKTALGKMMAGDTGELLRYSGSQLKDGLKTMLDVQLRFGAIDEKQGKQLKAELERVTNLWSVLSGNGLIFGAEISNFDPTAAQVTLIVPNVGKDADTIFALFRLLTTLNGIEVTTIKDDPKRPIHTVEGIGWWQEGPHAVVVFSTDNMAKVAKNIASGDHPRLSASPLYKKITAKADFEVAGNGFIDFSAILSKLAKLDERTATVLNALGINGLKSLTFISGFQGEAERSLVEISTGERKGLLTLLNNKPFKLSDAPPLPNDLISWSMTSADLAALYDGILEAAEAIAGAFDPQSAAQIQAGIKQVNQMLGIDVRKDLLGSLSNQIVTYGSPAEGPLNLNQTFLIRVKDPTKLERSMTTMLGRLEKMAQGQFSVKTSKYHDVVLKQILVKMEGFFFVPTYAIHNGWLILSFLPQPVQGAILRAKGKIPAWKPSTKLKASLAQLPKEMVGISVIDPRSSVKQMLAWAPFLASLARSFTGEVNFDISKLPNAHEVCQPLFPNVSIWTDNGKTMKLRTRASLALPLDLSGSQAGIFALSFMYGWLGAARTTEFRGIPVPVGPNGQPIAPPPPPARKQIPPQGDKIDR